MEFFKYQAAGNDFVLLKSPEGRMHMDIRLIKKICDRRFGIGADGLIILEKSEDCDFAMRFYNNDGSGGMMCGNGGRCIVDLAWRSGIPHSGDDGSWIFRAPDGIHRGRILSSEGNGSLVSLSMNDIAEVSTVMLPGTYGYAYRMNTGTEHLVVFCNDINSVDVNSEGRRWRYDPMFSPGGVNVNFVQCTDDGTVKVRTYERGVEYETLSCGTGIIAAAAAVHLKNGLAGNATYTLQSTMHRFNVSFRYSDGIFSNVLIEGPAELVFSTEATI